jgi:hypothetical protein
MKAKVFVFGDLEAPAGEVVVAADGELGLWETVAAVSAAARCNF